MSTAETVLVCDDEESMRRLAEAILTRHGYTVLLAGRSSEALALAAANRIDLLVSDVSLPEMSGPRLAERIRALRPEVGVVLMSGYTAEAVGARTPLPGASVFLAKPFDAGALLRTVRDLLDRREADP